MGSAWGGVQASPRSAGTISLDRRGRPLGGLSLDRGPLAGSLPLHEPYAWLLSRVSGQNVRRRGGWAPGGANLKNRFMGPGDFAARAHAPAPTSRPPMLKLCTPVVLCIRAERAQTRRVGPRAGLSLLRGRCSRARPLHNRPPEGVAQGSLRYVPTLRPCLKCATAPCSKRSETRRVCGKGSFP